MTGLYQTMPDSDGETTRTFAYIEYPETGWIETDKIMIGEEAKPMMSSSASSESALAKEAETEIVRNLYEMLVIMSEQQPKHLRPWLFDHFRTKRVAKKELRTRGEIKRNPPELPPRDLPAGRMFPAMEAYEVKLHEVQLSELLGASNTSRRTQKQWDRLWKEGLPPDARVSGQPLLHRACGQGNVNVFEMLVESGAHLSLPALADSSTPLEIAVAKGNKHIALSLALDLQVGLGRSVHIAAIAGQSEIFENLVPQANRSKIFDFSNHSPCF